MVGQPIAVKGKEFATVSGVAFNGADADSFTLQGNTLTAVVAPGTTSGPVNLTWFGGTVNGPAFTVDPSPAPTFKSFKPTGAHVGSVVTVTGTGFWGFSAGQRSCPAGDSEVRDEAQLRGRR